MLNVYARNGFSCVTRCLMVKNMSCLGGTITSPDRNAKGWELPEGHDTGLRIYNPCVKRKVKFVTKKKNVVSWYSCGPTVYDSSHIGHACCYITLDILRRILQDFFNLKIVMVMGVTDVDDKIIARAKEFNEVFRNISQKYEKEFFDDLLNLGVLQPSIVGRVTDFIPEIVNFVKRIIENGHGYPTSDGSVYFSVNSFSGYGKLVPAQNENNLERSLNCMNNKRSKLDFALWKGSKQGEPSWDSPWGQGRPGWHIECSTIASALLGQNIDIHSGGVDLMFPHHENEEAQSCSYHATKQWVNYWIHTGHLCLKGDVKMSKSLKNTVTIKDFLREYSSDELRMFCLISPYRNGMEYSKEAIDNAASLNRRFDNFVSDCNAFISGKNLMGNIDEPVLLQKLNETEKLVIEAFTDDIDTPKAVSHLLHLVSFTNVMLHQKSESNTGRSVFPVIAVSDYIQNVLTKLGFNFEFKESQSSNNQLNHILDSALTYRSNIRQTALRITKKCPMESQQLKKDILEFCDVFRKDLLSKGVDVKDHGVSTSWTYLNKILK